MKHYINKDVRKASLSHYSIFAMQDYLLQPGFHMLRGISSSALYAVIKAHGLAQPHVCGALLTTEVQKRQHVWEIDLLELFLAMERDSDHCVVEEYMATLLQYDFLLIETTHALLRVPAYGRFEQLLIDYDIYDTIPVIMILRN